MKKKTGFTLAEVLITLAIIGIIAALVLPAVLNNFQFRAVGTRLSKFMTTVENSTRAYVESDQALNPADPANIRDYVRRTFSISDIDNNNAFPNYIDPVDNLFNMPAGQQTNAIGGTLDQAIVDPNRNQPNNPPIVLKDGTRMAIYPLNMAGADPDFFPQGSPVPTTDAIGRPALGILFSPAANALPAAVRRTFGFVITDLGYVFPAPSDGCTWSLYTNRWQTQPDNFAAGTACADSAQPGAFPNGWQAGPRFQNNNNGNGNNNNNNGNNP